MSRKFDKCCVPEYLAVARDVFERELQVPVASADSARLDARVLLWPQRVVPLRVPEMLAPVDGITHHLHNRGGEVALSVHVFGT